MGRAGLGAKVVPSKACLALSCVYIRALLLFLASELAGDQLQVPAYLRQQPPTPESVIRSASIDISSMKPAVLQQISVGRQLYDTRREPGSTYRYILSPKNHNPRFSIVDIHTRRAALASGLLPGSILTESQSARPHLDTPLSLRAQDAQVLSNAKDLRDVCGWPVNGTGIERNPVEPKVLCEDRAPSDTPQSMQSRETTCQNAESTFDKLQLNEAPPHTDSARHQAYNPPLMWNGRNQIPVNNTVTSPAAYLPPAKEDSNFGHPHFTGSLIPTSHAEPSSSPF